MLDINYFLRAIRRETLEIVGTQVNVEDVKDELFDIVKPANHDRITVDDLIACRQGGTGLHFPYQPLMTTI
jgi:serine/threonine-protein phosphatase 2A regulatory subunit B''